MTTPPGSALTKAVCAVMSEVGSVAKTGRNSFHGYDYASEADILRALRSSMAAHGLALLPVEVATQIEEHAPTRKGGRQWRYDLVVTYELRHESGEMQRIQVPACGVDGEDKGPYKAMTGALKYALRQAFLIPTGDDPDAADVPPPAQREREPEREPEPAARLEEPPVAPPPAGHHPSWDGSRVSFCAELGRRGLKYEGVAGACEANGWGRPSTWPAEQRAQILADIAEQGADVVLGLERDSEIPF